MLACFGLGACMPDSCVARAGDLLGFLDSASLGVIDFQGVDYHSSKGRSVDDDLLSATVSLSAPTAKMLLQPGNLREYCSLFGRCFRCSSFLIMPSLVRLCFLDGLSICCRVVGIITLRRETQKCIISESPENEPSGYTRAVSVCTCRCGSNSSDCQ